MNAGSGRSFPAPGVLPPMPVVVGAPRSGTTLLRLMLDAHPELAIPPETGFLATLAQLAHRPGVSREEVAEILTRFPREAPTWPDFGIGQEALREALQKSEPFTAGEGARAFYRLYAARFGKARWGDKTPMYCFHIAEIRALLPEARFVHVIRDGRDVALSLRGLWFAPGAGMRDLARHWCRHVVEARRQGAALNGEYVEVRYEELVLDPGEVLAQLCGFLALPFRREMLGYHLRARSRLSEHADRVGIGGEVLVTRGQRLELQRRTMQPPDRDRVWRWKAEMTQEERSDFEAEAGSLLRELGYE